jgi:hypothetical protein
MWEASEVLDTLEEAKKWVDEAEFYPEFTPLGRTVVSRRSTTTETSVPNFTHQSSVEVG